MDQPVAPPAQPVLKLRLYIAGDAPNSCAAQANLVAMLDERLGEGYELEVVDSLLDPRRALDDRVIVTPTLVKLSPPPVRRITGALSEKAKVLDALGIGERSRG